MAPNICARGLHNTITNDKNRRKEVEMYKDSNIDTAR